MARIVFGMNLYLDGYVDHAAFAKPAPWPPLRLVAHDRIGENVLRLVYVLLNRPTRR